MHLLPHLARALILDAYAKARGKVLEDRRTGGQPRVGPPNARNHE